MCIRDRYFPSPDHCKKAISGYHKMVKLGVRPLYKRLCEDSCEYLSKELSAETVAQINNAALVILDAFTGFIDPALLTFISLEVLKFALPLDIPGHEWLMRDEHTAASMLKGIKAPMMFSVLYRDGDKRSLAAQKVAVAKAKAKAKAKAQVVAKQPAKKRKVGSAQGPVAIPDEAVDATIAGDDMMGSREKLWLDDLVQAVFTPVSGLPSHKVDEINQMFNVGIKFILSKKVVFQG
eukprot:1376236-Pyramimonas_sp.AAC.1